VFGAVARLGSGEWAYAATPLGFYVGCLSVMTAFARPAASTLAEPSPLFHRPGAVGAIFVAYALWRLRPALSLWRRRSLIEGLRERIWSPHAATIVIGVTFVITLLLAGRWAYTDVLADLARDGKRHSPPGTAGAAAGAVRRRAHRWPHRGALAAHTRHRSPTAAVLRRRGLDGLGQPADSRLERRIDPDRHPAAAPLRLAGIHRDVRFDRRGHAVAAPLDHESPFGNLTRTVVLERLDIGGDEKRFAVQKAGPAGSVTIK